MKTKEQIDEFTDWAPIGMIVQVPKDFQSNDFLDLNGSFVLKEEFPRLAEVLAGTPFDAGDSIKLIDSKELQFNVAPGIDVKYTDTNIKLVIKAK